MGQFRDFVLTEIRSMPLDVYGPGASHLYQYILNLCKPFAPGSRFSISYTVPLEGDERGKTHLYTLHVHIDPQGEWHLEKDSLWASRSISRRTGPSQGQDSAMAAIEDAVRNVHHHGGKMWVTSPDGRQRLVKDMTGRSWKDQQAHVADPTTAS